MQTDLPPKRLTQLRPADLLPLLGPPDATVLGVESLELPASKTSLDTLLRLRGSDGTEYLHLLEWQGYRDSTFLWRTLGYLAWLGQHRPERPILATVIYLHPGNDVGDTLEQGLPGQPGWAVAIPCVRLWMVDGPTALARDTPGLAALSPLMAGMNPALVEEAVGIVLRQSESPVQDELLTLLGIFAEDFVSATDLNRLISRERVMSSTFIRNIFQEEFDELERRSADREAALLERLRRVVEDAVAVRFPGTPIGLVLGIRKLADLDVLQDLNRALLQAADQAEAERILAQLGVPAAE